MIPNDIHYIIRKRALGDVLWIEPLIRTLAIKNKKLIVHTKFNALFENYPLTNVKFKDKTSTTEKILIRLEKLTGSHVWCTNLDNAYEKFPKIHFLNAYQQKAGVAISREYPKLFLSEQEKTEKKVKGKYVLLHLESLSDMKYRQVYGVDWEYVVATIISKGFKVIQIGLNIDLVHGASYMKTTLRELIALVYHSSYFVGIDSGPSHIAATLQIPALIFFGAVNPETRHFPELFKGIIMKKPCEYDDSDHVVFTKQFSCHKENETGAPPCCTYTAEQVIENITKLISSYA